MQNDAPTSVGNRHAATGLALVRFTIGAMLVWVFFENLGKGLYTAGGYSSLINYYIKSGHSPTVWKTVMSVVASHAALAAPLQAMTEISLGILLEVGSESHACLLGTNGIPAPDLPPSRKGPERLRHRC